ncbi:hypothetical protein FSARC_14706 [Fusarium sarcochroum]|uniref:Ubiquitin interaction domain-containing protein n=1 Tax=Fusarium sarcochroum TaxID=1208366 RepID=A0A8H4SRT2_9HYPO|nr:hypothetical protein FSARC_14706 [Fusarium sarcochroum]
MASLEPSEDEINQVIEFASLDSQDDRFMVAQALKSNSRSVEQVVGQYFDNADSFRSKYRKVWDDSVFTADRDGNNNNAGISFHVESSDHDVIQGVTPPPDSHAYGAPSRPPSRSNNRSPLGMMVDWATTQMPGITLTRSIENALTRPHTGVPNSHAQEEDDLQRVLRTSAQEAGFTMPQHESGITDPSASAPHFGPANRSNYDESSWAMVPSGPSKEVSVNEPLPSKRKRSAGAPALLVISNAQYSDHKLGGLLTIMHEIPIARNVLLGIGSPAATYGQHNDWWRGQEILSPEVLAKLTEPQSWDPDQYKSSTAFDEEIHRLMAFLDSTERGYGSVSSLTDLLSHPHNAGMEKQFYEMLGQKHPDQIQPIMQVAALAMFHGEDVAEENAKFGLLEIEHLRNEYNCIKTLYEALDHVMWSDTLGWDKIHEGSKMAYFKEMGEVLVLNTAGDGPEHSIEIPQELYPEKYLETRQEEARRIQYGWCQTKEEMARLMGEKERIDRLKESWDNGKIVTKSGLLDKASDQWDGYKSYLESLARFRTLEKSGFDGVKYPDYRTATPDPDDSIQEEYETIKDVIDHIDSLKAALDKRTGGIDTDLDRIMAKQRALGRLLTAPDKPSRPKPMTCKKYLLRGVVTSPNVVYVCQQEANLIELDVDVDESRPSDQWWRLAFTPHREQAINAEKIDIEEVLSGMWKETKRPLLVYATEEALITPKAPLSAQLERFVKMENKAFRQELSQEESAAEETKRATFDPISPSKRKHRADSAGSMDSNRASIGSDDRNGFDNPFSDQDDRIGTEMIDYANPADYDNSPNYVHSFDASDDRPPTLPARPQSSTEPTPESTSATMTPSTVGADHMDSATSVTDEARSPEMQERARPPPFMSLSRNPSEKKDPVNLMDMDIPDEKH